MPGIPHEDEITDAIEQGATRLFKGRLIAHDTVEMIREYVIAATEATYPEFKVLGAEITVEGDEVTANVRMMPREGNVEIIINTKPKEEL